MHYLFSSLITALIMAAISLVGVVTLIIKDHLVKKIILFLVSFSTGALMGGAFFHLLPEVLEQSSEPVNIFIYLLIGFTIFFLFERILKWRHCHQNNECSVHSLGYMNLLGDGLHNIVDGIIIVSTFMVSPALGIPVAISIILHEVPQEIGDFGVLLHAGFKKTQALLSNFIIALTGIIGVLIGYFLVNQINNINQFLLPFAAGGFIYIAASDLVPELHKETSLKKSLWSFIIFVIALIFMYIVKLLGVE